MKIITYFLMCGLCSCSLSRDYEARKKLSKVNSIVKIGDNIYEAEKKLKDAGFRVSKPYFPTDSKNIYWMDDFYGLRHTPIEQAGYGLALPFPTVGTPQPIRGKIEANVSGEIFNIY